MGLASPGDRALHQLLRRCTVRVSAETSTGTGFFVAPSLLVTCAHVVRTIAPGQEVQLEWEDVAPLPGRLTKKLPPSYTEGSFPDIALVQVEGDVPMHPCVLFGEDCQTRDPLYAWGYTEKNPAGESLTPSSEGEGRRSHSPDEWLLKFRAAQTIAGLSGAPLLNDRTGRVCGMIKLTRDKESELGGWAIRAAVILKHFPELRDLQNVYHKDHREWTKTFEAGVEMPKVSEAASRQKTLGTLRIRELLRKARFYADRAKNEIRYWESVRDYGPVWEVVVNKLRERLDADDNDLTEAALLTAYAAADRCTETIFASDHHFAKDLLEERVNNAERKIAEAQAAIGDSDPTAYFRDGGA